LGNKSPGGTEKKKMFAGGPTKPGGKLQETAGGPGGLTSPKPREPKMGEKTKNTSGRGALGNVTRKVEGAKGGSGSPGAGK